MNKIFKFMLVFAAAAFLFTACDKPEPEPTPDQPTDQPTDKPSDKPSDEPTDKPSDEPTDEPTTTTPDWCDYYFKIEDTCDDTALYGIGSFDLATITDADGKTIYAALGYETVEDLAAAVGTKAEALAFDREVVVFGYDMGAETDYQSAYLTNGFGYWVDANSNPVGYGENARMFIEWFDNEEGTCMATTGTYGVMNQSEGEVLNACLVFQKTAADGTVTRAGLHVEVTVEAFVDPEAGKYSGTCTPGTYEYTINQTMSVAAYPDYAALVLNVEELQAKIGLTKYELSQVTNQYDDNEEFFSGLIVETFHADGTPNVFVNAEGNEVVSNWVNAEGKAVAYRDLTAVMCFDPARNPEAFGASVCVEPINTGGPYTDEETGEAYGSSAVNDAIGKTISFMMKYTYIPESAYGDIEQGVVATVTYNISLTE